MFPFYTSPFPLAPACQAHLHQSPWTTIYFFPFSISLPLLASLPCTWPHPIPLSFAFSISPKLSVHMKPALLCDTSPYPPQNPFSLSFAVICQCISIAVSPLYTARTEKVSLEEEGKFKNVEGRKVEEEEVTQSLRVTYNHFLFPFPQQTICVVGWAKRALRELLQGYNQMLGILLRWIDTCNGC